MVYDVSRAAHAPTDPRLQRLVGALGGCPSGQALLIEAAAHNIQTGPRMGHDPILFSPLDRGVAADIQQLAYQLERLKNPQLLRAEADYLAGFRQVIQAADQRATAITHELGVTPSFNTHSTKPISAPAPIVNVRKETPRHVRTPAPV